MKLLSGLFCLSLMFVACDKQKPKSNDANANKKQVVSLDTFKDKYCTAKMNKDVKHKFFSLSAKKDETYLLSKLRDMSVLVQSEGDVFEVGVTIDDFTSSCSKESLEDNEWKSIMLSDLTLYGNDQFTGDVVCTYLKGEAVDSLGYGAINIEDSSKEGYEIFSLLGMKEKCGVEKAYAKSISAKSLLLKD